MQLAVRPTLEEQATGLNLVSLKHSIQVAATYCKLSTLLIFPDFIFPLTSRLYLMNIIHVVKAVPFPNTKNAGIIKRKHSSFWLSSCPLIQRSHSNSPSHFPVLANTAMDSIVLAVDLKGPEGQEAIG